MIDRVPDAVRRQAEAMEALDEEMAKAAAPPPQETPDPDAPEPQAEPPPTPPPAAEDWQHKFQTLQGKYNAEVPGLRNQIVDLNRQIEELRAAKPAPTPEPAPAAAAPKLITDDDTETYGADLIDLIRRVAVETDAGEKAKLQGEIADMRKQMAAQATRVETMTENVTDDRRAKYFTELAKQCPAYEETDARQDFKDWLVQLDDFSGLVRNDILQAAFAAFDADRTAKVFNQFLGATPPAPAPPPPPADPQAELAELVSPGQARTTPVPEPDDGKKVWSVAEMDQFYKDFARGEYRGRLADAQRIEADIDRALAEGRVR
jgi:hypothetical protein